MSVAAVKAPKYWIQNPITDLVFFSFGWLAVLIPLLLYENYLWLIITVVLVFNYVHRHYTFALVYGENEEFESRKTTYIVLPIAFSVITFFAVYFGVFNVLLTLSVIWTMYHSVAQKYGFTRIYSRKAGYGEGWIDKGLIFSWFVFLIFALGIKEQSTLLEYKAGRVMLDFIGGNLVYFNTVSYIVLAVAVGFTLVFAHQEFKNRHRLSIPKLIFVVSVLALYSIFYYDLVIGYIAFGFSHALEYIVFVNYYVKSKYKKRPEAASVLAKASKQQWLYSGAFSLLIVVVSLVGMEMYKDAFLIYIVGSSFLHFIYDGFIWKVRKPEVGKPLDIKYAST